MKSKSIKVLYIKALFVAISLFIFSLLSIAPTFAQGQVDRPNNLVPASPEERQAVLQSLNNANSSCPKPIRDRYQQLLSDSSSEVFLQGTLVVAYDENQKPIALTCANASNLQKIALRAVMVIFALLGVALFYAIARSSILMITSFGDSDKFETGVKSLITSIMYTVGVLFFYTLFIFVAVDVLGIGVNATRKEFNLFCSNRIVINVIFDDTVGC